MDKLDKLDPAIEKIGLRALDDIKALKPLQEKTKLRPSQLTFLFLVLLLILVCFNVFENIICDLVGFVYPAYKSFKALETTDPEDDKQWLTYWVVYSFFTVFDDLLYYVLSFLPFYYLIKIALYVYLFHPITNGASLIYNKFLGPFLKQYQQRIDQNIPKFVSETER